MLNQVLNEIGRRDRFLLTSHARPDGDAIGSVLACFQILRQMGKEAQVVLYGGVPFIYRLLPFADTVVHAQQVNGYFDAAIVLECDSIQRTNLKGLEQKFLINIDHHMSGRTFANLNWIDPNACATAEMIYWLAREAHIPITPGIATCLYTAVLADTGSFCFSGTNERTFALAQELVRAGADPVRIAQSVYFSNPTSKMRLLGAALSSLHRDGDLAWMAVNREQMQRCGASDEDCEGLVNYARMLRGVDVAALLWEWPAENGVAQTKVSLRSRGRVDVSRVAVELGGGGHRAAAGATVAGDLASTRARVLEVARQALAETP